jgi:hypothetical protein
MYIYVVAISNIALGKCCGGVFRSNLYSLIFFNYMNELGFEDSDLLVCDAVLSGE